LPRLRLLSTLPPQSDFALDVGSPSKPAHPSHGQHVRVSTGVAPVADNVCTRLHRCWVWCVSRCSGERVSFRGREFRLVRLVGEGGFSFVYAAEDVRTGAVMAVKKMLCQNEEQRERARREVEIQKVVLPARARRLCRPRRSLCCSGVCLGACCDVGS
jgi:hypothetical protein